MGAEEGGANPPQKTGAEISHESVGKVRISSGLRVLYAKSSLKPIDLFTCVTHQPNPSVQHPERNTLSPPPQLTHPEATI